MLEWEVFVAENGKVNNSLYKNKPTQGTFREGADSSNLKCSCSYIANILLSDYIYFIFNRR